MSIPVLFRVQADSMLWCAFGVLYPHQINRGLRSELWLYFQGILLFLSSNVENVIAMPYRSRAYQRPEHPKKTTPEMSCVVEHGAFLKKSIQVPGDKPDEHVGRFQSQDRHEDEAQISVRVDRTDVS